MKRGSYIALVSLVAFLFVACQNKIEKKKIFFVNSYHQGYGSSDDVMRGFSEKLPADSFEVQYFYLDSKRTKSETLLKEKVQHALDSIHQFNPDLLAVSDDNAIKYLVEPYFNATELPVLFCGVNWSAEKYHLAPKNVTGMLEVLPLKELLTKVHHKNANAEKLLILTENSTSSVNDSILLDSLYRSAGYSPSYALVDNFEQWKSWFKKGNEEFDLIYVPTNGAISGWNKEAAVQFVHEQIKVPVVTCDDFMMPYAVFGLTKVATEQGEWMAKTARRILAGEVTVDKVPVTKNKQSKAWLNQGLAKKIGFNIDPQDFDSLQLIKE